MDKLNFVRFPKWALIEDVNSYYAATRSRSDRAKHILTRRPILATVSIFAIILLFWTFYASDVAVAPRDRRSDFNGRWNFLRDRYNLMLDEKQCRTAFPGLFHEIDRAVNLRKTNPITKGELDRIEPKNGYIRAMIYDQGLYVIDKKGGIYSRELATLHALHREILSSPQPLPNIEFAFNTDDIIFETVPLWAYARKAEHEHIWLMPDFGYWSWPETKVGTMKEVQIKATAEEKMREHNWQKKIDKLLWRGATMGLPLRDRLLEATRDKSWADVVALDWHSKESMHKDLKSMPEHCDYKYLAHTEGNSYSGRLKYLQSCESVIVVHKMDWIQHHYPLMSSSGPQQNFVEIDREFNDLESTITYLQQHDKEAKRIARNSVTTFRERYLTSAAEACYWRHLIRGWASVNFEPDFFKNGTSQWRGLPFESFALEGRLEWDPY